MSMDGNGSGGKVSAQAAPVDNARAALVSLLKAKRIEKAPSQETLAKKLKKEIEDLRAVGVSFEDISAHLKASGIIISKKTLGAAVKKRSRHNAGVKMSGTASSKSQLSNPDSSL